VDANLKFVPVEEPMVNKAMVEFSETRLCYQSLETRSLQVPEDTVLPHSEITLPHVFVGDEACLLTNYLI